MRWTLWLGRAVARRLSPQELVELAMSVWPHVYKQVPRDQRVNFLKKVVAENLGTLLGDLERQERAALMNALFPLAVREFPLTDLDLLATFSTPGQGFAPQALSEDEKNSPSASNSSFSSF